MLGFAMLWSTAHRLKYSNTDPVPDKKVNDQLIELSLLITSCAWRHVIKLALDCNADCSENVAWATSSFRCKMWIAPNNDRGCYSFFMQGHPIILDFSSRVLGMNFHFCNYGTWKRPLFVRNAKPHLNQRSTSKCLSIHTENPIKI